VHNALFFGHDPVGSTFLLIIQVGEIWMHNITIKVGKKLKDPFNQKRGLAIVP